MEKELNNQVEFIIRKPIDTGEYPNWVEPMNHFDGMSITELDIRSEVLNALLNREIIVVINEYFFSLNWIVMKINGKEINKNEYISTV